MMSSNDQSANQTDTPADRQTDRLMLHFGTNSLTEVEVWDEETQEATHVFSQYAEDGTESEDLTRALERAGFRLEKIDE